MASTTNASAPTIIHFNTRNNGIELEGPGFHTAVYVWVQGSQIQNHEVEDAALKQTMEILRGGEFANYQTVADADILKKSYNGIWAAPEHVPTVDEALAAAAAAVASSTAGGLRPSAKKPMKFINELGP